MVTKARTNAWAMKVRLGLVPHRYPHEMIISVRCRLLATCRK